LEAQNYKSFQIKKSKNAFIIFIINILRNIFKNQRITSNYEL